MSEEFKEITTEVLEKQKKSTLVKIIILAGSLILILLGLIINQLIRNYHSYNEQILNVVKETSQTTIDSISKLQVTVYKIESVQKDMAIRIDTIGRRVSINTFILGELVKKQDRTTKTIIENVQRGFDMAKPTSEYPQPRWKINLTTIEPPIMTLEKEVEKKN